MAMFEDKIAEMNQAVMEVPAQTEGLSIVYLVQKLQIHLKICYIGQV